MSIDNKCFYCEKDQTLSDLMMEICKLEVSTLYLFKDQVNRGRCVVTYKEHVTEMFQLEPVELNLFMQDVSKAAKSIFKAFGPGKINYAIYGDLVPHLHVHVVPKYENGYCWGKPFEGSLPNRTLLTDEEYKQIMDRIKENL